MSDSSGTEAGLRQRRRLDPDVRIRQILDAAFEVFSQKGFVATRIDDIALHAGLSKGGIYNHFISKQAIFEAVVRGRGVHFNQPGISAGQSPVTVERIIQEVIEPVYNIFACNADIRLLRTIMIDGSHMRVLTVTGISSPAAPLWRISAPSSASGSIRVI